MIRIIAALMLMVFCLPAAAQTLQGGVGIDAAIETDLFTGEIQRSLIKKILLL